MTPASEPRDRITELRVEGLRALANVRLPLGGLTVLIGDNGSGKSSLLEALELLRKAARPGNFVAEQLMAIHGGRGLFRMDATTLRLGVRIEGAGPPLDYSFAIMRQGSGLVVTEEKLNVLVDPTAPEPVLAIERDLSGCRVIDVTEGKPVPLKVASVALALTAFGALAQPAISRVIRVLESGRIHAPFEVLPLWIGVEQGYRPPLREPAELSGTRELERLGGNLANCYFGLSQEHPREVWQRTLERVRAGLGDDVTDIRTPSAGRGQIELVVHFRGLPQPVPASALSDGQLAFLAFVALAELGKAHAFVAFDEPESHLHPQLLVRVTWLLEELAKSSAVVVSTHSDRLLDALSDPGGSVVLCELDEHRATRLLRPDPEALRDWLERYRGLGDLRAEGYERHVLTAPIEGDR